jgi:transmembrane sensor
VMSKKEYLKHDRNPGPSGGDRDKLIELMVSNDSIDNPEISDFLLESWNDSLIQARKSTTSTQKNTEFKSLLLRRILRAIDQPVHAPTILAILSRKYAVAASIIFALFLAGFGLFNLVQPDIASGKELTYTTITTKVGERTELELPDKSVVWLAPKTTIKYATDFGINRNVVLEGEAYFQVKSNPDLPFEIVTGDWKTKVLGTSFSVYAPSTDSNWQVSVTEGKVSVASPTQSYLLKRDQQLDFNSKSEAGIERTVENVSFDYLKTGTLIFVNEPLRNVLFLVGRFYGVKVNLKAKQYQYCNYTGSLKDISLTSFLKDLENTHGIEYSIQQDQLLFKNSNCR